MKEKFSENKTEQIGEIIDTKSYQEAIKNGRLEEAEKWLIAEKEGGKRDERWVDHREAELFRVFRDKGDFTKAFQLASESIKEVSMIGRLKNLKDELEEVLKKKGISNIQEDGYKAILEGVRAKLKELEYKK